MTGPGGGVIKNVVEFRQLISNGDDLALVAFSGIVALIMKQCMP